MSETKPDQKAHAKKMVVSDEAVPFVSRGGRIFSGQVVEADVDILEGEEVLVIDKNGRVLTIAQAFLTPDELLQARRSAAALSSA